MIEIDIRVTIDLEEGVFITLNIIQKKSQDFFGSSCDQRLSIKLFNQVKQIDWKNILIDLSESCSENRRQTTSVNHKRITINMKDFNKLFTLNQAL